MQHAYMPKKHKKHYVYKQNTTHQWYKEYLRDVIPTFKRHVFIFQVFAYDEIAATVKCKMYSTSQYSRLWVLMGG